MAKAKVEGPCVFCGKPAAISLLFTLRLRRNERRPTRIRVCHSCRRAQLAPENDFADKAPNHCP